MEFNLKSALIWMTVATGSLSILGVMLSVAFGKVGMTVLSVIVLVASAFAVGGLIDENP